MGKHFDSLIEVLKGDFIKNDEYFAGHNVKSYMNKVIKQAALFEFPLCAEEIFPKSGKDDEGYGRYLDDYFDMSAKYGRHFITPFKLTAIEDSKSSISLENIGENRYIVTSCMKLEDGIKALTGGTLRIDRNLGIFPTFVESEMYPVYIKDNKRVSMPEAIIPKREIGEELVSGAVAFIEQMIYIMDPENFIVQKESNQSIKASQKIASNKKYDVYPRKTAIRPHYVCINEDELKKFLSRESKEPRPFHPVRGHWRKLISEYYVNKKGQTIFIEQHFSGKGYVDGKNGWHYQVLLKQNPVTLIKA